MRKRERGVKREGEREIEACAIAKSVAKCDGPLRLNCWHYLTGAGTAAELQSLPHTVT